jgi:hypothetical protein
VATLPTFDDLIESGKREALGLPTRLSREIIDEPGSDVNIAFAAQASMAEKAAVFAQGEINATRLRTASSVSEDALEQFGASEFGGEVRSGPESAIVSLIWNREPGGASIVIAERTLVATAGGVTFETAADLAIGSGETGPATVVGIATTAGTGGNVPEGTITQILSSVPDPTLTVTNDERASGGQAEQSIEDYEAQLQSVFERARRGTLGAIEAAAATTPGVSSARAYEVLDSDGIEVGRVVVQILGGGGTTNAALAARVRERVREFRCAGVPVTTDALNPRTVAITATGLLILDGFDEAGVLSEARRALVALIGSVGQDGELQVGATLYLSDVLGVLRDTDGLKIPKGSLTLPTDDVVPASGEYLVTDLDSISLTAAS